MSKIKVALLGANDILDQIKTKITSEIKQDIILEKIVINHVEESLKLDKNLLKGFDVLLFAGHLAYNNFFQKISDELEENDSTPIVIEYEGSALYKSLFELTTENSGSIDFFTPFTIDFLYENDVEKTINEIGLSQKDFITIEGDSNFTTLDWADVHERYYLDGRTKYAVTCLTSVSHELKKRNIPVKRVVPTQGSINNAIQKLYAICETILNKGMNTAVIKVQWEDINKSKPVNYYKNYKKSLDFKYLTLEFCEKYQATFRFIDDYQVQIYTTESVVKLATDNYKNFHLQYDMEYQMKSNIYIGIGISEEIVKAEENALKSLNFSISFTSSSTYVTKHTNEEITGPLSYQKNSNISYSTSITNQSLITLSKNLSISPSTINKLIAVLKYKDNNEITAYNLAEFLGVSIRSANRLLKKLQEAKIAKVVGEDQPAGRGRPRKIFEINLPS